jgi:hypothetical protein
MSDFVHDLLVARRAIGKEGDFVFAANSKSRHIEEPKFAFEQVAEACGVAVTAHDLRRLFTTVANGTVSGRDARALVNHAVGGNVHDDYDMVTVEELRAPAQRVADKLKELCEIAPAEGVEWLEASPLRQSLVQRAIDLPDPCPGRALSGDGGVAEHQREDVAVVPLAVNAAVAAPPDLRGVLLRACS